VVLEGEWLHGKFFFVPVGAKKVGSVVLNFDKKLKTNFIGESFRKEEEDEEFKEIGNSGFTSKARLKDFHEAVHLLKGEEFGNFEGGSAFAIVFQHPDPHLEFTVQPPQFVLYGNPLLKTSMFGRGAPTRMHTI